MVLDLGDGRRFGQDVGEVSPPTGGVLPFPPPLGRGAVENKLDLAPDTPASLARFISGHGEGTSRYGPIPILRRLPVIGLL